MASLRSASLAASAAVLALSACGMMQSSSPSSSASTAGPSMTTELSGRNEVPPNTATGSGRAMVTLNQGTKVLTWNVTYSGLTGPLTGAHIHGPAPAGANAGVVVPFTVSPSPITGSATLTDAQIAQLMAGQWYVNLHTAANPGGEIRGQLR